MKNRKRVFKSIICFAIVVSVGTICSTVFADDENKIYYIAEGKPFYNGRAFMRLLDENNNLFWGQVDSNFNLIVNLKEEYGFDEDSVFPSLSGNVVLDSEEKNIVFYENGTKVMEYPGDEYYFREMDDYFIIRKLPSSGYENSSEQYGVMNNQGEVLFLDEEENLPIEFDLGNNYIYGDLLFEDDVFPGYFPVYFGKVMNVNTQELYELNSELFDYTDDNRFLIGDEETNTLRVIDENCTILSEVTPEISIEEFGCECRLSGDVISCYIPEERGLLYKTTGEKIFDTDTAFNDVIPLSLISSVDGYSALILKGINSEYNYVTMIKPDGTMCFEPTECVVENGNLINDQHLCAIPKDKKIVFRNELGEELLEINGSPECCYSMNGNFIFSDEEYCYYDFDGNQYRYVTE